MRVLHLVPSFPPNDFVLKDMRYSEKIAGVETLVLSTKPEGKKTNILTTILNSFRLAFRIMRLRPNVIHCHFMTSTLPAALAPIPAVVTIHESYDWYSPIWRALLKVTTRFCRTIFVSEYNRRYWEPVLGRRETVIYHAIDRTGYNTDFFDAELRASLLDELKVKHVIFSMGVNEPRRGLHLAVEAASVLREKGVDVGVVLKGYGGQADYAIRLQRIVEKTGVPTKMLTTRLSDAEMANMFASVDVFVRPTLVESFGIAVLEAQSCGTPTVVTDCCSLKEVFGDSSLTFTPKDPVDLADQVERLILDSATKERYRNLGLENAKRLSWRRKIKEYMRAYRAAMT